MSIEVESMNGNGSEVNGVTNGDHNGHHHNHHEEPFNYDTVFPSLPAASTTTPPLMFNLENFKPVVGSSSHSSSANANANASRRPLQTTIKFLVPVAERKKNANFGNESKRRCEQIAKQLNLSKFEMCQAKDQSLHIVITGSDEKALHDAKKSMLAELQIERDCKVKIPKDQHKFLIGKQGSVLKELQEKTATRIQVPKSDDQSDLVTINGPKEGIEQAIQEIRGIIDEQSRTGTERLNIPRLYHPWLRGFNNELANELAQRTGAKINIPPPHVEKDEITVSGDREKVEAAVAEINKIYAAKRKCNITKLAIQITKSQHRLIIGKSGSNLHEIFKEHDVYVQVPKLDSDQETIYLYGEESKLGPALSQVCANANSIVTIRIDVPVWLHRHMIGEKGANISRITADYPQTHVKFEQDSKIMIEGPPDEVEKVKFVLEGITNTLRESITCEEITCDPKFGPMLVGAKKTENHVARLNNKYGVTIRVPPSDPPSVPHVVRIEGPHDAVHKCKAEFVELLARLENERSKDIIIEQKFHSNLIGKNGKNLNEIRAKFNDVQIQIPSQAEKSDIVTIRGNKNDVEKCFKHLQQYVKDIQESNYQEELQIVKEFHRLIIGKQGAFIKKIRDETQTRIDIPAENSDSNVIQITGKQDQVRRAKKQIEDKVKELINIKEDFVDIPHQLHTALIGKNGNIIKHIRSECAGCIINFPPESNPNDNRIVLKGSAEQIKKAKEELLKLAEQKNDSSFQDELNVKVEYHKFLVGRNGGRINAIRDKYQVRIIFPNVTVSSSSSDNAVDSNNNNASITIMGKKENVAKAKEELEASIKSLEEQVTEEVEVDAKWHKNFTSRRAKLINEISEENCNVKISFPKQGTAPPAGHLVKVVGPRDAVDAAKKRILDIVFEYENQVTIECHIPNKYHAMVIGKGGSNTRKISDDFKVDIKFQAKGSHSQDANNSNDSSENNNSHQETSSSHDTDQDSTSTAAAASKADTILISGLRDNCEKAKQALLDLVPITEQVPFPHKYHKDLLANKAEILRELTNNTTVQINVPKKEEALDYIVLNGQRDSMEAAKQAVAEKLAEIELNNFTVEITGMKPDFIPTLRGRNNIEIEKLEKKYKVRIEFSKKGEPDRLAIRGLEKNAQECEAFLRKKIEEEESKVSQTIEIDNRIHSRLIGQQGKSRQKIMDKFHVEIKFPDRNSDQVIVKGKSAEEVEDACDHLKNLEEEYLADMIDKEQYVHPSNRAGGDAHKNGGSGNNSDKGFVVKGAPWEQNGHHEFSMPDTSNMEDFPTIGSSNSNTAIAVNGGSGSSAWGPSRR